MLDSPGSSRMASSNQKTPKKGGRGGRGRPAQLFPAQLSGVLDSQYLPESPLDSLNRDKAGATSHVPSTHSLMSFALPLPELERSSPPSSHGQSSAGSRAASISDHHQGHGSSPVQNAATGPISGLPSGRSIRASGQRCSGNQIRAAVSADEAQEDSEGEKAMSDAPVRVREGTAGPAQQHYHEPHLSNGHLTLASPLTKARSTSSSASYGTPAASPRMNASVHRVYPNLKVQSEDEALQEPKQARGSAAPQPVMVRAGMREDVAAAEEARCRVPGQGKGGEGGRGEVQAAKGTGARGSARGNVDTPPGSSNGREERSVGSQSDFLDSDVGTQLRATSSQEDARMEALLTSRWQEAQEHAMWPAGMSSTEEDTEGETHAGLRLRVTNALKDGSSGRRGTRPASRRRGALPARDRRHAGMPPPPQEEGSPAHSAGTPRAPHTLGLPEDPPATRVQVPSRPRTSPGSSRDCDSTQGSVTAVSASASERGAGGGRQGKGGEVSAEAAWREVLRGSPYASGTEGRGAGADRGRLMGSPYASGTEGRGGGGAASGSAAGTPRAGASSGALPSSSPQVRCAST